MRHLRVKKGTDNPYKPSGHPRDTTFEDECNYLWECGWEDGK